MIGIVTVRMNEGFVRYKLKGDSRTEHVNCALSVGTFKDEIVITTVNGKIYLDRTEVQMLAWEDPNGEEL